MDKHDLEDSMLPTDHQAYFFAATRTNNAFFDGGSKSQRQQASAQYKQGCRSYLLSSCSAILGIATQRSQVWYSHRSWNIHPNAQIYSERECNAQGVAVSRRMKPEMQVPPLGDRALVAQVGLSTTHQGTSLDIGSGLIIVTTPTSLYMVYEPICHH